MTNLNAKKTVFIGLSGGVDSAVSCLLLKQAGYNVKAVFMQNWDPISNREIHHTANCQASKDYEMAKKVADFIGVSLIKVNFVDEYWNHVFQPFIEKIKTGLIPNPDIACNARIKFNVLLKYLNDHYKFDYFATGHYAQTVDKSGRYHLVRGIDPIKDQTYFLAGINPKLVAKLLFPIGKLLKTTVRQLAFKFKLPNANRKDSMGICFIGKRPFEQFLQQYIPKNPGDLVDFTTNKVVGSHDGALFYTIGQRKRLFLHTTEKHFVIGKNMKKNIVYIVSEKHRNLLLNDNCLVTEINWFDFPKPNIETVCQVKLRHCQIPVPAKFYFRDSDTLVLKLQKPILAITPGQLAVLYSFDNEVLGSGIVKTILQNDKPLWYIQ